MFDKKALAVLKIKAKLLHAARCWFDENGYIEVQGPTLIPAVGDLRSHFEVRCCDKKAYLTQGLQPYASAFLAGFRKIYTIAPSFRPEKARTGRHLIEYWRIEVAQQCNFDSLLGFEEELLAHVCSTLLKEAPEELTILGVHVEDLRKIKIPFTRLTYEEVIEILQKDGLDIFWGQELDWEAEKRISLKFDRPFFVTKFPIGIQTLFYRNDAKQIGTTKTVDLIAPGGYGEISSGGQMEDKPKVLLRKMTEEKIEAEAQRWYINLKGGVSPNSGFVIGLERLVRWICKLDSIEDASAFPRLTDNLYP